MGTSVFKERWRVCHQVEPLYTQRRVGTFPFVKSFDFPRILCSTSPGNLNIKDSFSGRQNLPGSVSKDSSLLKQALAAASGWTGRTGTEEDTRADRMGMGPSEARSRKVRGESSRCRGSGRGRFMRCR